MFDQSRGFRDDAVETCPVEYVVRKDGKPFAFLNATPALATRTVTGFALATPEADWTFERI
ncbi:MAG: hypothetical protein H7Z12_10655 [Rhodospirillaceae bacterium]|nr:hypothetical protein [Rhodospirillales bacterium]